MALTKGDNPIAQWNLLSEDVRHVGYQKKKKAQKSGGPVQISQRFEEEGAAEAHFQKLNNGA